MAKFLNTLYITSDNAKVTRHGRTIEVRNEDECRKFPIDTISDVIVFSHAYISPEAVSFLVSTEYEQSFVSGAHDEKKTKIKESKKSIAVHFVDRRGNFLYSAEGMPSRAVDTRHFQHLLFSDDEKCLQLAKNIVQAKIVNQLQNIQYHINQYSRTLNKEKLDALHESKRWMVHGVKEAASCKNIDALRGIEGNAANAYWSGFNSMIRNTNFVMNGRTQRPPKDEVNALLSLSYTLFTSRCAGAISSYGLDVQLGYFHLTHGGRASLACDMVEEFRGIIDAFVLSIINKRKLNLSDFHRHEDGAVYLKDASKTKFFALLNEWLHEEVYTEWQDKSVPRFLLPFIQADYLVKHIRGNIDAYLPYLFRSKDMSNKEK